MSNVFISLENVAYTQGQQKILSGIHLEIRAGEIWALTGANGAGKSSLLRILSGETWPTSGQRTFFLSGEARKSPIGSAQKISVVSPEQQERYERASWNILGHELVLTGFQGSIFLDRPATETEQAKANKLLQRLNLLHLANTNTRAMSKGQLRRMLIARALVGQAQLLLLDEALSGLDAASRKVFAELLPEILQHNKAALVYTTHRPQEFLTSTSHMLHLKNGQASVAKTAKPEPAKPTRQKPETRSSNIVLSIKNASVYLGLGLESDYPMLFLNGLQPVLHNINWQMRNAEHWLITGENGSGKSTLARLMAGELRPALGAEITRFDLPANAPIWQIRQQIALMTHEQEARYRQRAAQQNMTGAELIGTGLGLYTEKFSEQQLGTKNLGIEHLAHKNILEMSHGELKKCLIARALLQQPRLLILDEPFDGLDATTHHDLMQVLEGLAEKIQMIVVTHLENDVPSFMTHQLHLELGNIVQSKKI